MTTSEPSIHALNELAKERTRAAGERTLSSWINNCLFLIGFGVTIDQIYPSLESRFSQSHDLLPSRLMHFTGLSFIAFGVGLLFIVMGQHLLILRFLGRSEQSFKAALFLRLTQVTIAVVLVFGVLSLFIILFSSS